MKRLKVLSGLLILTILAFLIISGRKRVNINESGYQNRSGTAIIITGAAARIPQEVALLEELYQRGLMKNVIFISGVSSGALNAVVLNGILSGKITWNEYKDILFNMKNSDVFVQEGKKLPVNTEPLRKLMEQVVEKKLGYHQIGDLPFMTELSFVHIKDLDLKKTVYRMCSRKINSETDTTLSLVDIMMASSAFPVAFPRARIKNVTTIPDAGYVDGGAGDDHVPFQALLEFEKFRGTGVERVYIISRKSDSLPEISEELKGLGINDKGLFDRLGINLDNILNKGFIKRLEAYSMEAPDLIPLSYVWIPDFQADFLLFDFDKLKLQYDMTSEWAKTHDPVPLADYLLPYLLKKE